VVIGPFEEVHVLHRRLRADDLELVRHADGGWHFDGSNFLELRVVPIDGPDPRLMIGFEGIRRLPSAVRSGSSIRLYADRLLIGPQDEWQATDDDESRSWVVCDTGARSRGIVLKAA
jgi:hypothetical protein